MNSDPLLGIVEHTTESRVFFHPKNIDLIQAELRYQVYQQTGILVGPQSRTELLVVMRSVYLQERVRASNVTEYVEMLNKKVIEYCVRVVASNAQAKEHYRVDINTMPIPMDRPVSTNMGHMSFSTHPEEVSANRKYVKKQLEPPSRGFIEPPNGIPLPTPNSDPLQYPQGPRSL